MEPRNVNEKLKSSITKWMMDPKEKNVDVAPGVRLTKEGSDLRWDIFVEIKGEKEMCGTYIPQKKTFIDHGEGWLSILLGTDLHEKFYVPEEDKIITRTFIDITLEIQQRVLDETVQIIEREKDLIPIKEARRNFLNGHRARVEATQKSYKEYMIRVMRYGKLKESDIVAEVFLSHAQPNPSYEDAVKYVKNKEAVIAEMVYKNVQEQELYIWARYALKEEILEIIKAASTEGTIEHEIMKLSEAVMGLDFITIVAGGHSKRAETDDLYNHMHYQDIINSIDEVKSKGKVIWKKPDTVIHLPKIK